VDDVVEGILAAGERGQAGRRYILGGENLSFSHLFSTIAGVVGHRPLMMPLPIWMRKPAMGAAWFAGRFTANRFLTPQIVGDMFAYKYYSSALAKQEFSWIPRYSFKDSIRRAWDFYQQEGFI
jgi:dihydroflavonol-4-reductase